MSHKKSNPETWQEYIFVLQIAALTLSISMAIFNTVAYYKTIPDLAIKIAIIRNDFLRELVNIIIQIAPRKDNPVPLNASNYRWFVFNVLVLAGMLLYRKFLIKKVLSKIVSTFWDKKSILVILSFILFTFFSNIFWGFWFSGIRGWDESQSYQEKLPLSSSQKKEMNFLLKGINQENIKKFIGLHCVDGQVVLGYTKNGVFALNDGISGIVFPSRFHNYTNVNWLKIVNYRLQKIRDEQNIRLIPLYPQHAVYNKISEIPDRDLFKIEYWDVKVCYNGQEVYISDATLKKKYD